MAEYFIRKGRQLSVARSFSDTALRKAGCSKFNGTELINILSIIMTTNIFSLIFNIISSILASLLIIMVVRPHIVIISVPPGETALGSYIITKFFRRKLVFDYRDEWENHIISISTSSIFTRLYISLMVLKTKCYSKRNLVMTVTESISKNLFLRGIRNVKIISNGTDSSVFKPYSKDILRKKFGLDRNDIIIIYSGGMRLYYELDVVIKALKKIAHKAKNLILFLVDLVGELDLRHRVFYLGAKTDRTELVRILSVSDVGIIRFDSNPLWKSALPAKAVEYFGLGLPAIATVYKNSLLGTLVCENKIGLISNPEEVDALSDNMCKIYNEMVLNRDSGKRAAILIQERFDLLLGIN